MRKPVHGESEAPSTRSELHEWVRQQFHLAPHQEHALLDAIDNVFMQHERLWQQSKQDAIQAVSAGFTVLPFFAPAFFAARRFAGFSSGFFATVPSGWKVGEWGIGRRGGCSGREPVPRERRPDGPRVSAPVRVEL